MRRRRRSQGCRDRAAESRADRSSPASGVGDDWSVQSATGMKSTASLFGSSAIVCVGPPLFCKPAGSRFSVVLSLMLVPLAKSAATVIGDVVAGVGNHAPRSYHRARQPESCLSAWCWPSGSLSMPPPPTPALLPEKVLLVTVSVPTLSMPPPRDRCAVAGEGAVGDHGRSCGLNCCHRPQVRNCSRRCSQ